MSKVKIGINGFGRIGRIAFRIAAGRSDVQVVGINDLLDVEHLAYLLKYDSVHGQFQGTIEVKNGNLVVNGNEIRVSAERNPEDLKWDAVNADVVLDCTGIFTNLEGAQKHITAGAKKSCYICTICRCTNVCNGGKPQRNYSRSHDCFKRIMYNKLFSTSC